mmetsp:Transcript_94065/g.166617  ORF Transcript_94065/g.166617 Transcript_94065/m.166617 type:complete len:857 (+) Transcript_94065:83-2653(+)
MIGRPPRPEHASTVQSMSGKPPRHGSISCEENAPLAGSSMCDWFSKKRDGLGSILGNHRLCFILNQDARTLSWAKQLGGTPVGSMKFADIVSVESKTESLEHDVAPDVGDQNSNSAEQPSRSSSASSRRSLTARVRSLSPFRKSKPQGYSLTVSSAAQHMELRCESQSQASQWLAALKAVIADTNSPLNLEHSSTGWLRESAAIEQANTVDEMQNSVQNMCVSSTPLEILKPPRATAWHFQDERDVSTACSSQTPSRAQSRDGQGFDLTTQECPHSHTPPDSNGLLKSSLVMEDFDDGTQIHIPSDRVAEQDLSAPQAITSLADPQMDISSPRHLEQPRRQTTSSSDCTAKPRRNVSRQTRSLRTQGRSSSPNPDHQSHEVTEEGQVETRKMFDKRELRRRNKDAFEKQLLAWRERNPSQIKAGPAGLNQQRVRVCVRKRPLFSHEENEFDTITVNGSEVVVHNCLTKADLKSLFVSNMGFHFAQAFGECSNDVEVYKQCAEPAVQYALQGGSATIFMFGQTGSGKTHTMQALLNQASACMFGSAAFEKAYVGAFEIAGKHLRDLQDPEHPDKDLRVMVDLNTDAAQPGQLEEQHSSKLGTRIEGLKWTTAESAPELLHLCRSAQAQRATRATQANSVSSRSHSIIRIGRSKEDICLTLVDCAGSERNEDSTNHSAQDRRDAADINSTIFALKECFRIMCEGKKQQPPFRNSLLTRVLADSFTNDKASFVAIGTVSPSSKDTEHSIETLKSLQMLQGTNMTFEKKEEIKGDVGPIIKHPRTWSEAEVQSWFEGAAQGRAASWKSGLPKNTDGKMLVRMPVVRFSQICGNNKSLGDILFKELREEMKRADDSRTKRS